jgi:CRISPR-associated protein Csb2
MMLAIEVAFLTGRYCASDFRSRERAEWPPHPSRLFSALVAAAYESGLGESARAALLWLESLPPPCLSADEAVAEQTPVIAYVPVNDPSGAPLPQRTERQPRGFPSVVPSTEAEREVPIVHFIWPDAQPDSLLRELLESIVQKVTYLGSSRSPVHVRLEASPPSPNWNPDESGEVVLRVPSKGRLENLERTFKQGLRPTVGAFQRYMCGRTHPPSPAQESAFGEMVVYRLGGSVPMEIETTLKLTDALRAAAMRCAQNAEGVVPELLSGHDEQGKPSLSRHAAFVALPFVSETQVHADGRVMGMAVVLPRELTSEERRGVMRSLVRINHLLVPGVGRLDLERITPDHVAHHNLRVTTWTGPRRQWASVTPVVLDRFPKRGGRGTAEILARSCENVGLPRPAQVIVDRFSPLHGVEPSFRFVMRRPSQSRMTEKPDSRLYTHVMLTFEQPIRGPVIIGAGRHFGLGLLRPIREESPDEP